MVSDDERKNNIQWATDILKQKIDENFYGDITFKITDGHLTQCIQNTSLHPPSLTTHRKTAKTRPN